MSFGQGMNPTMVQVASGFSSIINGGTYYHPTVIKGTVTTDGTLIPNPLKTPRKHVIKASTSSQVRQMVVKARHTFAETNDRPGYTVGGKTGTSQTLINNSYDNNQTVATYLGFGGDSKPRYVIMVQVSGKGKTFGGSTDAMPIFTDISNWMIDYLKLQPKG
jgi:cell division protein FtsI/penicillin-binding protein 2